MNRSRRKMEAASEARGAERDALPRLSLRAWREQHLYAALSSLGRLLQRPGASLLTVAMMALSLLLPLLLAMGLRNADRIDANLGAQRDLIVFLKTDEKPAAVQVQAQALRDLPMVAKVSLRTPEEGLAELKRMAGFGPALALLEDNPLPSVLLVAPRADADRAQLEQLAARIGRRAGVDFVHYDVAWRERLARMNALARRATEVAAVLLALGAVLVVGNSIRLDVGGRAEEIQVMHVVGAEPAFIRRPFLYAGIWYGSSSALVALAAAGIAFAALADPVAELAQSYDAEFRLVGPGWALILGTLAAGIVLGWLGARTATALQLARDRKRARTL